MQPQASSTTPLDLYAAAAQKIEEIAEKTRKKLAESRDNIARFQALCDVLREQGLEFEANVTVGKYGADYSISTRQQQGGNAGKLMLALAALGCEGEERPTIITGNTLLNITGPGAPEFSLYIDSPPGTPLVQPGASCHAAEAALPDCGDAVTGQPCLNESAEACGECLALITESEAGHAL